MIHLQKRSIEIETKSQFNASKQNPLTRTKIMQHLAFSKRRNPDAQGLVKSDVHESPKAHTQGSHR